MTKDVFEPVLGAGNDCDPKDIFIGATCDQGRNSINALESMGIPVNVCDAHKNNSVVGWGLGINGSANTCKNEDARKLMNKAAAMVGHFSHSTVNNDAFKDVQKDMEELEKTLELVRRNDTRYESRWGGLFPRVLRWLCGRFDVARVAVSELLYWAYWKVQAHSLDSQTFISHTSFASAFVSS